MRKYELSVLIHPDLEMNLEPALNKIEDIIKNADGKIVKVVDDGKKRMAYSIKGQDYAIYYYYDLELPAEAPAKIERSIKIADEVLRSLLVLTDPRKESVEEKEAEKQDNKEV